MRDPNFSNLIPGAIMAKSRRCALCSNPARPEFYEPSGSELCSRCGGILRRLCDRLVPLYDIEPDRITLGTSWLQDLHTDSLDMAELVVTLEEEFGATITDEEAQKVKTVEDLVRLLARRSRS